MEGADASVVDAEHALDLVVDALVQGDAHGAGVVPGRFGLGGGQVFAVGQGDARRKPRRISSVSGVSSLTKYCLSTWWAGGQMSWARAPSSVSSTKPVLVLSRRPAGNSSRRG